MKILMLGNSLTTANGMPEKLAELLDANVRVHARGGARLAEHLNPATKLGALTQAALNDKSWDFVVLQEMSNGPVRSTERFFCAVAELAAKVCANGATPVLYATWAHAPWCGKLNALGLTHRQMHEGMAGAYREAAMRAGALLAPVCDAFFEHDPIDELYAADGVHPSETGSQLAAQVIAETIRSGCCT